MISTRIKRGAVRTHVLIRNKIENYNSSQVRGSARVARSLALGVLATRLVFLTVPVVPTAHAAALPDMPADSGEPPSTLPVGEALKEGSIDGVLFNEAANDDGTELAPFTYDDGISEVTVGKSFADQLADEQRAKDEAERAAKVEAAKKAKAKQAVLHKASAAPVTGDIVGYAHDAVVAAFGEAEWPAMYQIIMRESGFNPNSYNARSGACGLFQALPCAKMGGMELDRQVNWGIGYIRARYGTPSNAWVFWQLHHWY